MNIFALQAAGTLAIFAAVGHGFLGDKTLRAQPIEPAHIKNFIRVCYQFGAAGWLAGGILFLIAPSTMPASALPPLVAILAPVYVFGALTNLWFTRGFHAGWVMLLAVVVLAIIGIR